MWVPSAFKVILQTLLMVSPGTTFEVPIVKAVGAVPSNCQSCSPVPVHTGALSVSSPDLMLPPVMLCVPVQYASEPAPPSSRLPAAAAARAPFVAFFMSVPSDTTGNPAGPPHEEDS